MHEPPFNLHSPKSDKNPAPFDLSAQDLEELIIDARRAGFGTMSVDARTLLTALEELRALRAFEKAETRLYDVETEQTIADLEEKLSKRNK